MSSDLYSAQGVEPFLEYQSASPPVSPEHTTAGRDGYFPAAQQAETSVAWSRRKSVSSKSPSAEYPPRPIFTPSSEQQPGGSSPTTTSPPASPSAASATSGGGGGGVSGLLRRKSSKVSTNGSVSGSGGAGLGQGVARRPSASALARKSSQQSRLTASSPSVQPLALPPSPTAVRSTIGKAQPSSPPALPSINTNFPPAGSPPRGPNATLPTTTTDQLPLPPPLTAGTTHRLSTQHEQPTPPLTPDLISHALFQPPLAVVANRPAPYAAVAGPPASPVALGRGTSSRRTSETSSGRVDDSLTTTASSGSSTVSAFGEPAVGNKAKAPAAADLSNPWRSQTERPLDTVRRLSRLVDGRDMSYQANRHSSYGLAATLSSPTSGRSDDPYADSSSSSSITPSSTPLSPWGGLPSSMSMSGPYPTSAPMVGAYPLPNRTVVTPFALDASPWPVWQSTEGTGISSDGGRSSRNGTVKRKGTAGGAKQRRQSDVGPASKPGGGPAGGLAALQVAPTYSRSPLSQASSPEPSPPFIPSSSSAPPSIAEGRPSTLGRTKSAKRRLSFWRSKSKDGEDERADVVPPLPASPAGIRLGKGGGRDRVVSTPPQQQQPSKKEQAATAASEARSRRAASEPLAASTPSSTPSPAAPDQRPGSSASVSRSSPLAAKTTAPPPSDAKVSRGGITGGGGGGGFGSFLRRFATLGRKGPASTSEKTRSAGGPVSEGVNELGQKTALPNGRSATPVQPSSSPAPSPAPASSPSPAPAPQTEQASSLAAPSAPSSEPPSSFQAPMPARIPSAGSLGARSTNGRSPVPPASPPTNTAPSPARLPAPGSPQRVLPLAPGLPVFDGPAETTTMAAGSPSRPTATVSPMSSPSRELPHPPHSGAAPTSPGRTPAAGATADLSPRSDQARRMSKKLSSGSLPSAVSPNSGSRPLPDQPQAVEGTSPRQLPLAPGPSAGPAESDAAVDAVPSPTTPVGPSATSTAAADPPALIRGSSASSSTAPLPTSATDTIRPADDVLALSPPHTAGAPDELPALVADHEHDQPDGSDDTPARSLASSASIATPGAWEASPPCSATPAAAAVAPAVVAHGVGGKSAGPETAEAVVSEA